ncbi:MAG: ferredoxin [Kiloniellaceae bacterium]
MTEVAQDDAPLGGSARDAGEDPAPYFRCHVFCCMNERPAGHERGCCKEKGAIRLRNYLKARAKELGLEGVRINQAGCLDRCEFGPTMVIYPEGVWYHYNSIEDAEEILQIHLVKGGRVKRLMLHPEDEMLPGG